MKQNTIIMLGKPGSGKGEQSKLLAEATGFDIISSGGRFRDLASQNTVVGKKVKDTIDNGILMPHWFASYTFLDTALFLETRPGAIYDGAARKKPEAVLFDEVMNWLGRPYMAVYINVPDEVAVERLVKRKETQGRHDDDVDAIKVRIQQYYDEAESAIEHFRSTGNFIEVQGERSIKEVSKEILQKLEM